MRKRFVLAALMLALLTLKALMPVVKAVTYYWDGICFVEGINIRYPHPNRDYYGISPYSGWSKEGVKLYHNQIDHDKSENAKIGIVAVCGIIGIAIGATLAPPWGAAVGGIVGLVLGAIAAGAGVVLQDELGCVWWWTSIDFMDWLTGNLWWLGPLAILSPTVAEAEILYTFLLCGYLRIGSGTLYDAVGAGNPSPSTGGGGETDPVKCPTLFVWNGNNYTDFGVIDIHAEEDVIKEVAIPSESVGINNCKALFRLREGYEELTYSCSHIDQIKLYAIDNNGNRYMSFCKCNTQYSRKCSTTAST